MLCPDKKERSQSAACRKWKIGLRTFQYRVKQGLSIKEALTMRPVHGTPLKERRIKK